MPKTLYNEEGEAVEVPTEEELTAQRQKVEEYDTAKAQWEEEKKKMAEEVNPNWSRMREKEKRWEEEKRVYQKQIEELGGKAKDTQPLTREEMERIAEEKANKISLEREKDRLLRDYDAETRKSVEFYFNKFSSGETLDGDKLNEYMSAAEKAAGAGQNRRPAQYYGKPPVFNAPDQMSDVAKEFARDLELDQDDLKRTGHLSNLKGRNS